MRKRLLTLLTPLCLLLLLTSCGRPDLSAILGDAKWDQARWDAAIWSK